jgi:hypothetical protein
MVVDYDEGRVRPMETEGAEGQASTSREDRSTEERFRELLRNGTNVSGRPRQVPGPRDLWSGIRQIVERRSGETTEQS